MTAGAISHHPFSGPVCLAFAMGAAQPIPFLTKMTLTAELIAVIKVYLLALGIGKNIAVFLVMTFYAGQPVYPLTMLHHNIAVGKKGTISGLYLFIGMAGAAWKTGYGIFPGKHLKRASLVGLFRLDRFHRQLMSGFYFHAVKRLVRRLNAIHNRAVRGRGDLRRQPPDPQQHKKQTGT
ncbi:MAG: hypothetical protein GY862_04010 [Gammaproteobacteria bacterium]|nr:hypothetical protein [Gammaproteobacteria bacterium]